MSPLQQYLRSIFLKLPVPQILQNLGKADKTTDEIFEEHLMNFNTQQVNSTRLHKDINNYLRCIRGGFSCPLNPFAMTFHYFSVLFWVSCRDQPKKFTLDVIEGIRI